ncbi:MAG: CHASE domain-containing protein [Aquabacterium sp.]|uniref:CHASE domain-containing protein n=1 Tax=Aquabacterium sp. TaxID=1872578 RepID=UPI0025BB1587|nr:CHASE domain-containing protein [Aquabacterium sp.]MBI3381512.1 CHASE domain-containing protein [Aquabacterium sp.]
MNWREQLQALKARWFAADMALSEAHRHISLFSSVGILLLGLFLTVMGSMWIKMDADQEAALYFDRYTDKMNAGVAQRFTRVLNTFQSLRAHIHADDGVVRRDAFRIWVASRRLLNDMKGIRGVGFIQRTDRVDLDAFVETERRDAAPGFSVRSTGNAADLYVIKYIEPLSGNEAAWGYDIGAERIRRETAERAVNSGHDAMTGSIVLVQDGRKRPGFLYILPVFKWASKVSTPEDRRRNLVGLVYSPIVVEEFLADIGDTVDSQLDLTVYDGQDLVVDQQIFSLALSRGHARFESNRQLDVGGHILTLHMRSTPEFEQRFQAHAVWWFALVGCLLSMAMSVAVWLLLVGRARAEGLARIMTADLSLAKQRAELALRDNSTLLGTLNRFNLMSVADANGVILDVNEAFCLVTGYSRAELIGHKHQVLNSGRHNQEFWTEMWQTISRGEPWNGDVCDRTRDGLLLWLKTTVVPLKDANGGIEKYLSIRTDITSAKRNELELQDMAERYQLAIDGGSDGLWDWRDVRADKMWWSPQLYRMLGYGPDEFPAGRDVFGQFLHPDHHAGVFAAIEGALKKGKALDVVFPVRHKSGQYRWVRSRGKTYFDESGRAIRMAGSLQDIHDRHLAEEVIQKHSEQLSAIFSLSPDGFVSFGADGRVNYASAAYSQLTGLRAVSVLCLNEAEFLSQLLSQCVHPPELSSLDTLLDAPVEKESLSWQARHSLVLQLKVPAGRMLALSLYQAHGDTVSRLLLVRDVTHEAEVDRMKSAFLSMAAHELRTPMASIYGFIELMMTRELRPEKQKDLLGKVYRQCEVMISIINELLDLARIESQRGADFECRHLDLFDLVAGVVADFKTPADRQPPELRRPDAAIHVNADHQKLCQAFLNLLSNAYKYSPQGGAVNVSFPSRVDEAGGQWVGVCVQDHGLGMSADQLAHLGERFFRADKSGNIPGTGLGVSIVKEVMELMGGSLDARSELGKGTAMTLWLPAVSSSQTALMA